MDADATECPKCGAEYGFFCPVCDREVPADALVCPHCGAELETEYVDAEPVAKVQRAEYCGNCGGAIGPEDEECPACGVDLCTDCGGALRDEETECPHCGARFVFACPECEKELPLDADVCPHCGFEFEESEEVG
jgi:RNA polymerase subunit RPABC4/transcription elongation factor Spt4